MEGKRYGMKPNGNQLSNNQTLDFFKLFWVFVVFSMVGTLSEGIYWIFRYGHFAYRTGMVFGPFSPVYGMATTLILVILYRYRDKSLLFLFAVAYLLAVLFEFTSSVCQQLVFGFTSWDYGNSAFAVLGRAHLIYAIPWALFGLLMVKVIYPCFCRFLARFPRKPGVVVTWIVFILMVFNAVVSSAAIMRYQERLQQIPADNGIRIQLDRHFPDSFLEKRYSRLAKSSEYAE